MTHIGLEQKKIILLKTELIKKQKATMDINEILDFIAGHPNIHATPAPQPLEQGWPNNPACTTRHSY